MGIAHGDAGAPFATAHQTILEEHEGAHMIDNNSCRVASGTPFIDPTWTVRDVTTRYPASVAVFKALNVEACCDAGRSLDEAATRAGFTRELLIETLQVWIRGQS